MSQLPPVYVNAPASLVYGDLPRAIVLTGIRIWGLGWRYRYERTDPVSQDRLCEVCGVERSQLYEHLGRLVDSRVLRYTRDTAGRFVFHFPASGRRPRAGPSPENRTGVHNTVVVDDLPSVDEESLSLDGEQQQQVVSSLGGDARGGAAASGFPDWEARGRVLERMGVMQPTRAELQALAWASVEYLEKWSAWMDEQDGVGPGLVVTQIRAGMDAPLTDGERARRRREDLGIVT